MDDAIKMLCNAIRDSGARMTMDRRRSTALPCWRCETTDVPRDLIEIGRYTRAVGGNNLPGDRIDRPMCPACVAAIAEMTPAASQAVAPPEPVEVGWYDEPMRPGRMYAAFDGPLEIEVYERSGSWFWDVSLGGGSFSITGGVEDTLDAAKSAAIAAARAWRDSIRL